MCEKIKKYWEDLDVNTTVNKRELLLGVAVCTLAGLVTGMLCSPRKTVTLGSHNSNYVENAAADENEDDEDVVKF